MKRKELTELKQKTLVEIDKILAKKREEFLKAKVAVIDSKERNLRKGKALRREIAQIMTVRGIISSQAKKEEKVK